MISPPGRPVLHIMFSNMRTPDRGLHHVLAGVLDQTVLIRAVFRSPIPLAQFAPPGVSSTAVAGEPLEPVLARVIKRFVESMQMPLQRCQAIANRTSACT